MRVHALTVTAFGPFADTVTVDLDEVGRDGLFLLWGPTGSGKTTLLDAIVFALYGTVPGPRGEEKRLRSDHADPGTRTEVRCELTLGEERLSVLRRPEQRRPKKRGAGVTSDPAQLLVQRRTDDGWEPVATRVDEGSEHLRTRLGLSAEQFCQVVLLPQGEFARFLRADPEDRSRLLRTLFDVDRFARAETWLADERRVAAQRVDQARSSLSALLARVAQTADVAVPEDLAPDLLGAAGTRADQWVVGVRAAASARVTVTAELAETAAATLTAREAELSGARAALERHARRDRAVAELSRVQRQAEVAEPLRARWTAARRAEPLRDVLGVARRAAADHAAAAARLVTAEADWEAITGGGAADTAVARALRDEAARLQALLPAADRHGRLQRELPRLAASVARADRRIRSTEAALAAVPGARAAADESVSAAERALAALPGLRDLLRQREGSLAAAREVVQTSALVVALEEDVARRRTAWLDARDEAADLRSARLDGMAAELAAGLADGADCPVCGSVDHPRPAASAPSPVTAETEDAAHRVVRAADVALQGARTELEAARSRRAAAEALAGGLAVEDQEREAARAQADVADTAAVADTLTGARSARADLEAQTRAWEAQLVADRAEAERHRAAQASTTALLEELRSSLAEAAGDGLDVASALAERTRAAHRCEELVDARVQAARTRAAAVEAEELVTRRLTDEGFPDAAAAGAALAERGEIEAWEARLAAHTLALAAAEAAVAEPGLVGLGERPDESGARAAHQRATDEREAAVAAALDARRRDTELTALAGDMVAARVELDQRRDRSRRVGALADLVNGRGSNALRMRLQSFVLAARLEQVADVASRRLQDMSGGRYTFLHSDAAGRNGTRGGLGLDVLDEYTGVRRHTKTLSGGESFMASLALALGLADVVTAESGGVRIDTLFVDEGFGTLDPAALDAVMGVLDELRRGGRSVGLVSHVEELRTRIPSRIEVVPGRGGSRLAG